MVRKTLKSQLKQGNWFHFRYTFSSDHLKMLYLLYSYVLAYSIGSAFPQKNGKFVIVKIQIKEPIIIVTNIIPYSDFKADEFWKPVPGLTECIHRPRPYYIADDEQCDKYYLCKGGDTLNLLCADGMAFQFDIQSCVLLAHADCTYRPRLRKPYLFTQCLMYLCIFYFIIIV